MKLTHSLPIAALAATGIALIAAPAQAGLNLKTDNFPLYEDFAALVNSDSLSLADEYVGARQLDAGSLYFANGVKPLEVYLIDEMGGFKNTLKYSVNGGAQTIVEGDGVSFERMEAEGTSTTISQGDGVDLGSFDNGSAFDFHLSTPKGYTFSTKASDNADGLSHVVAYEYYDAAEDQIWTILGFEDVFGEYDPSTYADRDFNDVVIAIKGVTGFDYVPPEGIPEPTSALALLGVAGLGLARRRQS